MLTDILPYLINPKFHFSLNQYSFLSFGHAEIGLPIIGGPGTASFTLSALSTSLRLIDYSINGGQNRFNRATESFGKLMTGAAFGRATEKAISCVTSFTIQKFPGVIF